MDIVDQNCVRGRLDSSPQPNSEVRATLPDGRRVYFPGTLVRSRQDEYELLGRFSDLPTDDAVAHIPLAEEVLDISMRRTETPVRIRKFVREHEQDVEQPILHEHTRIERIPVNRPVDGPIPARQEGDAIIISLLEEEVVTTRRWILREEVRITKVQTRDHRRYTVKLKQEDIAIERDEGAESRSNGKS